ncbi:MAG: pyruvate formate lyase-activating protein [Thermofilum sp. ex4484_15]|nr:MAG: pyruvate formate lyase-activating protein [Thermofilum sp. ex4484_15]
MTKCKLCGKEDRLISSILRICLDCLRKGVNGWEREVSRAHKISKTKWGLPFQPPKAPNGVVCPLCSNKCSIGNNGKGFCGLLTNRNGKLSYLIRLRGYAVAEWYYDPIPTNCVASWFCPATTGAGYPKYALSKEGERGYYNLAVFYGACNLDCLYCQNWHYRRLTAELNPLVSTEELVKAALNEKVTCICFFGGDPTPQLPHALAVAKESLRKRKGKILRICWETNGLMSRDLLNEVIKVSLSSGGIIKVDVKAWNPRVYKALTGADGKAVWENLKFIAKFLKFREEVPLLAVSTLLVPGYVDVLEVRMIARFIASLDPSIPYTLLAFHPDYLMDDLPPTSLKHASEALKVAKEEGLTNVRISNVWLLGPYY